MSYKLPAIFFGHGNPMNALYSNEYAMKWKEVVRMLPRPKSILAISAHWETSGTRVTSNAVQRTIHDFYGFPKELFDVEYNVKGDPELAEKICKIIPGGQLDDSWGLDHGTWSVLRHVYPEGDIPTVQLSLDVDKTLQEHYEIAKRLRVLQSDGVLIVGSGNVVHNLRMLKWSGQQDPYPWALSFNEIVRKAIIAKSHEEILNYQSIEGWENSVPTPEHFIPLLYILALQIEEVRVFVEGFEMAALSMMSLIVE